MSTLKRIFSWAVLEKRWKSRDLDGLAIFEGETKSSLAKRMLKMAPPGKRKRCYMDGIKEAMMATGLRENYALKRANWRGKFRCGDPWLRNAERRRRKKKDNSHSSGLEPPIQSHDRLLPIQSHDRLLHYPSMFSQRKKNCMVLSKGSCLSSESSWMMPTCPTNGKNNAVAIVGKVPETHYG